MAIEKTRALNIKMRDTKGDTSSKKYNYIKNNETATAMKTAVENLVALSSNTYIDADIIETYSLNEAADEEEEANNG